MRILAAEWFADKSDEFGEVMCCVISQGHTPKTHVTRTGRRFR